MAKSRRKKDEPTVPAGTHDPVVKCSHHPQRLTITLPMGSWNIARDVFRYVSEALKEKAWAMSGDDNEDACYIEKIADAIWEAIDKTDGDNQNQIRKVFG